MVAIKKFKETDGMSHFKATMNKQDLIYIFLKKVTMYDERHLESLKCSANFDKKTSLAFWKLSEGVERCGTEQLSF